jgi:hypothetical protein
MMKLRLSFKTTLMIVSLLLLKAVSNLNPYQMFPRKLKYQPVSLHSHKDPPSVLGLSRMEKLQSSQSAAFLNLRKVILLLRKMVQLERLK